jgi:hypothetical protein
MGGDGEMMYTPSRESGEIGLILRRQDRKRRRKAIRRLYCAVKYPWVWRIVP